MSNNIKSKMLSGLFWRTTQYLGTYGVNFIVSIILARLLMPEMYGTITIANAFISVLSVFAVSGFERGLIQKKEATDEDFSTVFYFNVVMSILLYILLFLTAPRLSIYLDNPELTTIFRVMGLSMIITSFSTVPSAYINRQMQFRKLFLSTLIGTIVSAFVGIFLAFTGFGIWALIIQTLTNNSINVIVLWLMSEWRPKFIFSFKNFKTIFSYSWKLLISGLIYSFTTELQKIIIGKKYTSVDLAYYSKGIHLPQFIINTVNTSIGGVLFPALSIYQNDRTKLRTMTRRAIKTSSFIMWPICIGLAAVAEPFTVVIYTEKWLPMVQYMQIACIVYGFIPIHTANLQAIQALGRSDVFLRLEIVKAIVNITILIITAQISVFAISIGLLVSTLLGTIINSFPNHKLIGYTYIEQMKDILPSLGLSLLMGAVVYLVSFLNLNIYLQLVVQVILGIIIYIGGAYLFRLESFKYLSDTIKEIISKKDRRKNNEKN